MPTTSKGFPYPSGSDSPNVPSDIQNLAANIDTYLDSKANLVSPTFTGTPAAPTAADGTNTTQIATTAFVKAQASLATARDHPADRPPRDRLRGALGTLPLGH